MKLVRLDDYQSWRVDVGGVRVLIDPWLTNEMTYAFGMATRRRSWAPEPAAWQCDVLVLTTHFGDHLHPPSLAMLPRDVPAYSTPAGSRRLRKLGFTQVRAVAAGARIELSGAGALQCVAPSFPFSGSALGLLFHEGARRAYLEAHVTTPARLKDIGPVDALVSTAESVRLFGIQLSMGVERASRAALAAQAKVFAPTGLHPQVTTGLLPAMLSIRSEPEALARALQQVGSRAEPRWLKPGESVEL